MQAYLNSKSGITRGEVQAVGQRKEQAELRKRLGNKRQELRQIKRETRAAEESAERVEHKKRKKRIQQKIFQLKRELRAAKKRAEGAPNRRAAPRAVRELETGALPDFVVIGTRKSGTSFLYHLLTRHPHVEPAAKKELHYFDFLFEEESVEWYRRCFPEPRWKDGLRTITGEATPGYLPHPLVPRRMAEVVPQARLITLLRNPVDRAYSDYQQVVRKGRETQTFEKATRAEKTLLLDGPLDYADYGHLSRSIYVDHLLRWSEYFPREQMLILKSEDFFEHPQETLKPVLSFLGLPDWDPPVSELSNNRNKGGYERGMDPATRRRLEGFFEPHNRRLYEYLGQDFGW